MSLLLVDAGVGLRRVFARAGIVQEQLVQAGGDAGRVARRTALGLGRHPCAAKDGQRDGRGRARCQGTEGWTMAHAESLGDAVPGVKTQTNC